MKKYPHQELIREAIKNADFRLVVDAIGTALDAEGLVIQPADEIVRLRADLAEAGDVPPMSAYYRG